MRRQPRGLGRSLDGATMDSVQVIAPLHARGGLAVHPNELVTTLRQWPTVVEEGTAYLNPTCESTKPSLR
jgi:hypothetical protein